MNGYELSRNWFDFCFENPEKIKPNHSALYFFAIEHCNRLGWKDKFGFPTTMAMEAVGIKSYNTYINTLKDLVDFGFIKMIESSKNQYSANIIGLSNFNKALDKALDKAIVKHTTKQSESTSESISSIDKPLTINQKPKTKNNNEKKKELFDTFWNLYDKKIGRDKCFNKFLTLSESEIQSILKAVPNYVKLTPDEKYRKNPQTYLNGKHWEDEIEDQKQSFNPSNERDSNLVYYRWHDEPKSKVRTIDKSKSEEHFKMMLGGGYKAIIL